MKTEISNNASEVGTRSWLGSLGAKAALALVLAVTPFAVFSAASVDQPAVMAVSYPDDVDPG